MFFDSFVDELEKIAVRATFPASTSAGGQKFKPIDTDIMRLPSKHPGERTDWMKGRIPAGTKPVARDPFGNYFLKARDGGVYFWDHENESTDLRKLNKVAPNMTTFNSYVRG